MSPIGIIGERALALLQHRMEDLERGQLPDNYGSIATGWCDRMEVALALGREGVITTSEDLLKVARDFSHPTSRLEVGQIKGFCAIRASNGHSSPGFLVGTTPAATAAIPTRVYVCVATDEPSKELAQRIRNEGALLREQLSKVRTMFHLRLQPVGYPLPRQATSVVHVCVSTAQLQKAKCPIYADQTGTLFSPGIRGRIPKDCVLASSPL